MAGYSTRNSWAFSGIVFCRECHMLEPKCSCKFTAEPCHDPRQGGKITCGRYLDDTPGRICEQSCRWGQS